MLLEISMNILSQSQSYKMKMVLKKIRLVLDSLTMYYFEIKLFIVMIWFDVMHYLGIRAYFTFFKTKILL